MRPGRDYESIQGFHRLKRNAFSSASYIPWTCSSGIPINFAILRIRPSNFRIFLREKGLIYPAVTNSIGLNAIAISYSVYENIFVPYFEFWPTFCIFQKFNICHFSGTVESKLLCLWYKNVNGKNVIGIFWVIRKYSRINFYFNFFLIYEFMNSSEDFKFKSSNKSERRFLYLFTGFCIQNFLQVSHMLYIVSES